MLKPKIYSRLAERQANEELMNANVEVFIKIIYLYSFINLTLKNK